MTPRILPLVLFLSVSFTTVALSHDSVEHTAQPATIDTSGPTDATPDAVTGEGDYRFRYHAELSKLPEAVAAEITRAHGGFAKRPTGEVYFGLPGVGVIRVSADLKTKTVLPTSERLREGALHNTTYTERAGQEVLIVPDPQFGRVHVLTVDGEDVDLLERPDVNDYYVDAENPYRPTDTEVAPNGLLYICDGYSNGKFILTAGLDELTYRPEFYGGKVPGKGRTEGKFSTNHGVTWDPADETMVIADRERQWAQKLTLDGEFVSGVDMEGANPCDVDFIEHDGKRLMVAGCLVSADEAPGVVQLLVEGDEGWEVVSTLKPKADLGLQQFQHIHNAAGVVVEEKLYILCYGWNPGCYAVLEHVAE